MFSLKFYELVLAKDEENVLVGHVNPSRKQISDRLSNPGNSKRRSQQPTTRLRRPSKKNNSPPDTGKRPSADLAKMQTEDESPQSTSNKIDHRQELVEKPDEVPISENDMRR